MVTRNMRKITHIVSDLHHFLAMFSHRHNKSIRYIPLFFLLLSALLVPSLSISAPLDNWTARTSNSPDELYGIAYGNGTFVAVGDSIGGTGSVATSPDGVTWTFRNSGTAEILYGVAYGTDKFVAVGSGGKVLTSPDGITWTSRTSNTTKPLYAVAYGNNLYVAVGDRNGAGAPPVITSPDGITWTSQSCGVPTTAGIVLKSIAYGGGKFVAVSNSSKFITATDSGAICSGSQWSEITTNLSGSFSGITYGNSTFVAVGDAGKVVSSSDGVTWAVATNSINSLNRSGSTVTAVTPSAHGFSSGDVIVISGADQAEYNGSFTITVTNATTFTYTVSGSPATPATGTKKIGPTISLFGVAYGDGKFVAVGGNGKIYSAVNTNLNIWTPRGSETVLLNGIVFVSHAFVAVGAVNAGSAKILQSANTDVHTVTGAAGANGAISPLGAVSVDHNYTTTFTVTPDAHYHVVSVSGCGGTWTSNPYTTGAITGSCQVDATFAVDTNSLSAVKGGYNSGSGTVSFSSVDVAYNGNYDFTVTASAAAHHHISSVAVTSGTCSVAQQSGNSMSATYRASSVTGACQITATFAIDTFTVTSTVSGANGTISPSVPADYGSTKEFTLTPDANYHSSASGCNGSLVGNTYTTGAITADCTVTASFPIDTHTVTTHVAEAGTGSISPENPVVTYNVAQNFTITPSANYHIDSVTGSGCTIALVSGTTYRIEAVTDNCSITATFLIDTYEITPSMVGIPPNGTISPANTTPVAHGASQLFEFAPTGGFHVKTVIIDAGTAGEIILGANTNSYTFENITSAHTVSVEFEQNAAVLRTVLTSANTGGTVSCAPNPVSHASSSVCTITPAAGYHLQSLLDNNLPKTATGGPTQYTYTAQNVITDDRLIKATFELYITATATPSAGGTIDTAGIDTSGRVSLPTGGSTQYSITPNTGYHIESVTLDGVAVPITSWNTYTSNPYTVDVFTTNRTLAATFAKNTYTITPTVTPGGSISPSSAQTVEYGGSKAFTFIADDGNKVSEVLVNGTAVTKGTSWTFENVTSNQTLKVSFELFTYDITVNAGAGGKINASGSLIANWGESRTFTIVPDKGYHIVDVTLDGTSIKAELSTSNAYVLSNIKAVHTVAATFAIDTFTITATSDSNGSITPSGAATVNYGTTKIYTLTPKDGYHILSVTVDGTAVSVTDGTYTFADIDKDHSIAVTFSINTYSIIASAGANGTISPSGTSTVDSGTSKTFTITPGEIYHVADVKVDGSSVGAVTSYQFTDITANHTIEASFEINAGTYTVTVTRTGMGNGVVTSSPSGINCGVTCSKTVNADTTVTLTAISDSGSEFGGWIGGGCSGTDTCTVNKNADATVNAVFIVPGQVSLTVSKIGTGNGDVRLTSTASGVVCGTGCMAYTVDENKKPPLVKLTATVKADSKFSGWSGDCAPSKLKPICSVTMESAKAAIANFDLKVPNIVLTPTTSLPFGTAKVVKNTVKAVTKVVKITNKGDGDLKISNIVITGDPDFTRIMTGSITTIKPKKFVSLKIKFTPTSAGPKSAELQISSNDPVKPLATLALSGTRAAVSARVSKASDEGMFYPDAPVTREEAAAFVIRAVEGGPADDYCMESSPFADVSPEAWSCKYVKRADELGLLKGCRSDNAAGFCPGSLMSREEMAALIVRAIEGEPEAGLCETGSPFADVAPDRWSCGYIKRFNELGIDTGYEAHNLKVYSEGMKFSPEAPATREETATYLIRALEGEPPADYCKSGTPFDDVTYNNPSCRYIKRLYEIWTSLRTVR